MKTSKYFKSQHELIRAWHSQSYTSGRTKAHIFFEGNTIYSYGYHFPIARIEPDGRIILTLCSYSPTTARHIRYVTWSLSKEERANALRMFLGKDESENDVLFMYYIDKYKNLRDKARSRKAIYDNYVNTYVKFYAQYVLHIKTPAEQNIFTQDF